MVTKINAYTAAVIVVGYIFQLIIYFKGGVDSMLIPVMMFVPGVIALIMMRRYGESVNDIGWKPRKLGHHLLAVLLPLGLAIGFMIVLQVLGWASIRVFTIRGGMVISTAPLILGNHAQGLALFGVNLTITFILLTILGGIFALGEEIGWRGYLQGIITKKYGTNKGLILLGLIWGFWHTPLVLMGWTFPEKPVLGAFILYPISTVFLAIITGWLYDRTKSIWTPTWFHSGFNSASGLIFSGMTFAHNELTIQIMWMVLWGIMALLCLTDLGFHNQGSSHISPCQCLTGMIQEVNPCLRFVTTGSTLSILMNGLGGLGKKLHLFSSPRWTS